MFYYSAFRLPFEQHSLADVSLQQFCAAVRVQVGAEFVEELRHQLELLNVPEASEALETLVGIWLSVKRREGEISTDLFEREVIKELQLEGVWDRSSRAHDLVEGLRQTLDSLPATDYPQLASRAASDLQLTPLASLQESAGKSVAVLDTLPAELSTGESLKKWLTRCCDAAKTKFQVTKEFVTQTADVAWRSDKTQLRLIQPCQRFYKVSLEAWLRLGDSATPSKFVEEIRSALEAAWSEKLLKPCLFFFKVARNEWDAWQEDPTITFQDRVARSLLKAWNSSIIDSCRLLTTKNS